MKSKVRDIIKILGVGMNELILDMDLGDVTFNSIEWDEEGDKILLHIFEDDDYDYYIDFDDLNSEQQNKIYVLLSIITYN